MAGVNSADADALVVLAHGVEPGDALVGRFIADVGPVAARDALVAGSSGLRAGPGLQARLAGIDAEGAVWQARMFEGSPLIRIREAGEPTGLAFDGSSAVWVTDAFEGLAHCNALLFFDGDQARLDFIH